MGHGRTGYHAYDSLTGKVLGRVGALQASPDGLMAINQPARDWGHGCLSPTNFQRIALDGSRAVSVLAVDPVPKDMTEASLSSTHGDHDCADRDWPHALAFAPSGRTFAIVTSTGVHLFRPNGKRLAREKLPFSLQEGDQIEARYSESEKLLLVVRSPREGDGAVRAWYRIKGS
jgi:hypothetical protein